MASFDAGNIRTLGGKVILVTGGMEAPRVTDIYELELTLYTSLGTSDLGFATIKALARCLPPPAWIYFTCNDRRKGDKTVADVLTAVPDTRVSSHLCDLASFGSINEFCGYLIANTRTQGLDILIW